MSVSSKPFGKTATGEEVFLWELKNKNGMCAKVTNFGAILVALEVPDQEGTVTDVVLGFDQVEGYQKNPSFFGATIGPNANRIGGASFSLDGVTYQLDDNDGGNNLHSHIDKGYHKRVWKTDTTDNSVTFYLEDRDGNMGFPGNKSVTVTYSLDEENRLQLEYDGVSDKNTILNFTNHSYFNLLGHKAGNIEGHVLQLDASKYTPVVPGSIPTGELALVEGTPMDFRKPLQVGEKIEEDFLQLKLAGGYDHNWVIDNWDGTVKTFAKVTAPGTTRTMTVSTDLPGVQFYAGNFIDPQEGKEGAHYGKRSGLCLETQFFPDTANKPEFPSAVFGPERKYHSTTVYAFSW